MCKMRSGNKRFFLPISILLVLSSYICINLVTYIKSLESATEYVTKIGRNAQEIKIRRSSNRYITIICDDKRRIGNLLFSYASLLGISRLTNVLPVLDANFELYDIFRNLSISKVKILRNDFKTFRERFSSGFDSNIEAIAHVGDNIHLRGYFQSWKYFENINDLIRKEFQFNTKVLSHALFVISTLKRLSKIEGNVVKVGIHVRRGDIVQKHVANFGYTTPDKNYYFKAIDYFRRKYKNVMFVVCSDDIRWCRRNIKGHQIIYAPGTDAVTDLAILSSCDHVIMSTGSFGWWGAWLANGTTIYYSKWPRPNTTLDQIVKREDYFLEKWIPMP